MASIFSRSTMIRLQTRRCLKKLFVPCKWIQVLGYVGQRCSSKMGGSTRLPSVSLGAVPHGTGAWRKWTTDSTINQEEVFGACAGAALYRRSMLDEIGLFDEDFFLYTEDVDLAFRSRLAGWKCMYVPSARVVHIHGGTAGPGSEIAVYFLNRNLLWYIIKNFPPRVLFLSMPWILVRNCCDIPYYLLRKRFRSIVKSKIDAVRGLRTMLKKRKTIKKK